MDYIQPTHQIKSAAYTAMGATGGIGLAAFGARLAIQNFSSGLQGKIRRIFHASVYSLPATAITVFFTGELIREINSAPDKEAVRLGAGAGGLLIAGLPFNRFLTAKRSFCLLPATAISMCIAGVVSAAAASLHGNPSHLPDPAIPSCLNNLDSGAYKMFDRLFPESESLENQPKAKEEIYNTSA